MEFIKDRCLNEPNRIQAGMQDENGRCRTDDAIARNKKHIENHAAYNGASGIDHVYPWLVDKNEKL